jgi:hypothetical protein
MVAPVDVDDEPWPSVADPVRAAIGNLLEAIIESTEEGSRERQVAMSEALQAHERVKQALAPKPRLN